MKKKAVSAVAVPVINRFLTARPKTALYITAVRPKPMLSILMSVLSTKYKNVITSSYIPNLSYGKLIANL